MKLTVEQLRRIIKEEVSRAVLREALDPAQLADMQEEDLLKATVDVVERFGKGLEQTAAALKGMAKEGDPARLAAGVKTHMERIGYDMEGLQMCADAWAARGGG